MSFVVYVGCRVASTVVFWFCPVCAVASDVYPLLSTVARGVTSPGCGHHYSFFRAAFSVLHYFSRRLYAVDTSVFARPHSPSATLFRYEAWGGCRVRSEFKNRTEQENARPGLSALLAVAPRPRLRVEQSLIPFSAPNRGFRGYASSATTRQQAYSI